VNSFKAYNLIDRATLRAAIEAAHARGAKVTGHLCSITYREAADLGIDNLEHGFLAATDWVEDKRADDCPRGATQSYVDLDLESPAFTDLVDHLIARGVAITSTLTVFERRAGGRPQMQPGALDAIAEPLRGSVARVSERGTQPAPDFNVWSELLPKAMAMERYFHERGGLLLVGTDPTGSGDVVPGYANLRALELLVESGFDFEAAVRIATLNGATYLGRDSEVGTVEVGKLADLVLIDGDPTVEVGEVRRVEIVFRDGIGWDSRALFDSVRGTVGIR
jgi:enamidase